LSGKQTPKLKDIIRTNQIIKLTNNTTEDLFMYFSTDDAFPARQTSESADIATRSARQFAEDAPTDRDHRTISHRDRPFRGSYYVFREGALQMRLFDRQAIGW